MGIEETTGEVVTEETVVEGVEPTEEVVEEIVAPEEVAEPVVEEGGEPTPDQAAVAEWDKFTYSVRDEERNFEDWTKPFIKDEDTYKKFQDLYTARDGLEIAKTERDEFRDKFSNLNESLNTVNKFVQNGDAKGFITALGLNPKMFIDYAVNELKYAELPPEERARVDAENQARMHMHQLQVQNENLQTQYQNTVQQQRSFELENTLASADVSPLANEYDARVGRPGAFKQLAIERGIYNSQINGRDISAQEAVNEAINLLGLRATGVSNQPNVQAGAQGQQTRVIQTTKPVIPNFKGRGTSPLKKSPTSIEDIKAIRAQRFAASQQ